jgi:amidohydrolase
MKNDIGHIENEVQKLLPKIRELRHYLHAHPELSLKEFNTSLFIREYLLALDIKVFDPYLKTDVVALMSGKNEGKNVTLRADIDALPLLEKNDCSYHSLKKNVMHACGHDGHTAILLGTAKILEELKNQFSGSVRFVFQPGEEIVAAGRDLVGKAILENPKPDAVLALHAWPGKPVGAICSKPGPLMAASDLFKIIVKGKGGHGSKPEAAIDPIFIASRIVNSLYSIPSRKFRALDAVVISICKIQGGFNANVISDEAILEGTVRYFCKSIGKKMPTLFESVISNECKNWGASYELDYTQPYIPTVNDPSIVAACRQTTQSRLGESSWIDLDEPVMSSEDFSYYTEKNPGAMFFLGVGEKSPSLHSPQFDFNDEALMNGMLFFVLSTLKLLRPQTE